MNRAIPVSMRELVALLDSLSLDAIVGVADASWELTNSLAIHVGREEKLLDGVQPPNLLFYYEKFSSRTLATREIYFIAESEKDVLRRLIPAEVMFL